MFSRVGINDSSHLHVKKLSKRSIPKKETQKNGQPKFSLKKIHSDQELKINA